MRDWNIVITVRDNGFKCEEKVRFFYTKVAGAFFLFLGLTMFPGKSFSETKKSASISLLATMIPLPPPWEDGKTSVERALRQRRSIREFSDASLSIQNVSQLLWAAQGVTDQQGLRTAPSAGALNPLEVYVVVGSVRDLAAGVYRYLPKTHQLKRILKGDKRSELASAALGQSYVKNNAVVLVFSAVEKRTTGKYGRRGIRYIHMEAGHAAQNVYLQAVSLGLGTVTVGAFEDDRVRRIMKMSEEERPLYLMPVGKP
jgi:SagB-type dehydrogenase family enzyme